MTELRIAADLALPIEAVTQTFAILAKRGVGKTYTALVLVEELLKARLQVVVADPIGVCWGLRASADGKTPGLPIAVLGGDHGDVPLEETAGQVVADLLVDERLSAVLDLSLLRKGQQVRFMTDFAERLYHRNRSPLQLVLDEADAFAPQRPMKGQERMLGAVEDLVRRGRARGIGVTLVTQRAAVLNKDVLTQVEVLVALRTIAPQDRAAIDEWIRVHGTPEQREELMRSLPSLPIGEAWFWSPGWLDLFQRVHVRPRETFDSSATPKVGQKLQAPKTLADVDLDQLSARLARSIEQQQANDPRALHARIRELERALAARAATGEIAAAPVIDQAAVDRAADAARRPLYTRMAEAAAALDGLAGLLERAAGDLRRVQDLLQLSAPAATVRGPSPPVATVAPPASPPRTTPAESRSGDGPRRQEGISMSERKILDTLATLDQLGARPAHRAAVGALAGYSWKGGRYQNLLGSLRSRELLSYPSDGAVALTEAGRAIAQPTGAFRTLGDLHEAWYGLLDGGQRRILSALVDVYPQALSRGELASRTGYEPAGGRFQNLLGSLRTLGVVDYPERGAVVATELLFPEGLKGARA